MVEDTFLILNENGTERCGAHQVGGTQEAAVIARGTWKPDGDGAIIEIPEPLASRARRTHGMLATGHGQVGPECIVELGPYSTGRLPMVRWIPSAMLRLTLFAKATRARTRASWPARLARTEWRAFQVGGEPAEGICRVRWLML